MSAIRLLAALIAALFIVALASAGKAQGVVFYNSDPLVTVHSTFTGQAMTLFGNVEPSAGEGPFDVIIVVRGPASDRIVRLKDRKLWIMVNAEEAVYRRLPGYYGVLSSRPPAQMLSEEVLADPRLSLAGITDSARVSGEGERFDAELIRLMSGAGLFQDRVRGVTFLSPTTFSARIPLPASVPNGQFTAQAIVIARGDIVAAGNTSFVVRTEGFERFVARTANGQPLIYGLAAIIIALGTGWLGGILFKR